MFARGCTARECFQKIAFTFTIPYLQGLQAPFPAFDVSQTFHTQFCESDVKRLRPFAPAGNAREPLYTGTFSIGCESESKFFIYNFGEISILLCIFASETSRAVAFGRTRQPSFNLATVVKVRCG